MKRKTSKLMAFLLSMVMVIAMAVPAMAETVIEEDNAQVQSGTEYSDKVVSVKDTGEDYGMFPIGESTITDNGDGTYKVKLHVTKATYTGFYFGYAEYDASVKTLDVEASEIGDGYADFEFDIPADYLGTYQAVNYWNSKREDWVATTYYLGFKNLEDGSIGEIPTERQGADPIEVEFTVSCKGLIAEDINGLPVAGSVVRAEDIDKNMVITYDEALVALHNTYYEGGAEAGYECSGSWVMKLWGYGTGNFLFFNGIEALQTGVTASVVNDGDILYASVNSDDATYMDYFTTFDKISLNVYEGKTETFNLSGYSGMNGGELTAIAGAEVGLWENGEFVSLDTYTDENGDVTLSFNKSGLYLVTAKGSTQQVVDGAASYTVMETTRDKDGRTVYGKMDWTTYDSYVGYTEKDYGDGAYPYSEIQWISLEDFDAETFDEGYLLYSGNLIMDCPLMAPYCVVVVEEVPHDFKDVPEGSYYEKPVYWALVNDITKGTGDMFYPEKTCTRAEIVTFLWRAAGCPEVDMECEFTDVNKNSYYYKAVLWAVSEGITTGTSETTFSPEKTCTRAEAVTFIWRAEGKPVVTGYENPYSDVADGSYYCKAVLWASAENITKGTGDKFNPKDTCTRAQIVTFIYRDKVQ